MITVETILQEASTLRLAEQYRLGLQLLERAQSVFAKPAEASLAPTIEERRAAIRAAQEQFKNCNLTTARLLEYKREEVELEESKLQGFYAEGERLAE